MISLELHRTLKQMFVDKFGVGREVALKRKISFDTDFGVIHISKVRYNGNEFEIYFEGKVCGWQRDKVKFHRYAEAILSDCLDVEILQRNEYYIV